MRGQWMATTFVALGLVLGACGGGDDTDDGVAANGNGDDAPVEGDVNDRGSEPVTGDEITVEAGDFFFAPTFLEVDPGSTFTVTVENLGAVSHTFTIEPLDVDLVIEAGEEESVELTAPDPATAEFFCRFHAARGMRGGLVGPAGADTPTTRPVDTTVGGADGGGRGY